MGDKMVAPEDARENVLLSYLANQQSIHVAKTDRVQEGTWVRSGKMMIIVIWWQRKILVTHPKDCKLMKTPFLFLSRCLYSCLLYTSPSPRDKRQSRMPSSA